MAFYGTKKRFQPETSFCRNKWCENSGNIPASGNDPSVIQCGSLKTMEMDRLLYGGITGRGVTPCPIGVNPRQSIIKPKENTLININNCIDDKNNKD